MKKVKRPAKRNVYAQALRSRLFAGKKQKSAKLYSRKTKFVDQ